MQVEGRKRNEHGQEAILVTMDQTAGERALPFAQKKS